MITIKDTIIILTRLDKPEYWNWTPKNIAAIHLAVEALKEIQSKRITMSYHPDDLLPGEKEE